MQEVLTEEQLKKRKLHRARVSLGCMVLILAVGVVGNWYWENSDISTKISTVSAQRTKTLGEATFVDATTEAATENSYFTQAKLDRQSSRDAALEKLQKWRQEYSTEMISLAIDKAAEAGKRSWNYINGILSGWQRDGIRTPGDVAANEQRRQEQPRGKQATENAAEAYANIFKGVKP